MSEQPKVEPMPPVEQAFTGMNDVTGPVQHASGQSPPEPDGAAGAGAAVTAETTPPGNPTPETGTPPAS